MVSRLTLTTGQFRYQRTRRLNRVNNELSRTLLKRQSSGEHMAAYLIVDTRLTNPEMYELYKLKAKPLIETYGGEYLARGGKMSILEDTLWTPTRLVLIKFPSIEVAETCMKSAAYQEILKISKLSAERTCVIFEGM
jgi:uncharacterized protein (DUF1330 family)